MELRRWYAFSYFDAWSFIRCFKTLIIPYSYGGSINLQLRRLQRQRPLLPQTVTNLIRRLPTLRRFTYITLLHHSQGPMNITIPHITFIGQMHVAPRQRCQRFRRGHNVRRVVDKQTMPMVSTMEMMEFPNIRRILRSSTAKMESAP